MNKLLKTLIILSCALLSGLFSVSAGSIATVDVQKVLSEYVEFNQAVEKVRAAVAPIEEEIAKMQEEVTNIIAEAEKLMRVPITQLWRSLLETKLAQKLSSFKPSFKISRHNCNNLRNKPKSSLKMDSSRKI